MVEISRPVTTNTNHQFSKTSILESSSQCKPKTTRNLQEYTCGWGAAFINISVTFPIHKVIFRQMRDGVHLYDAIHQLRQDGLHRLYRGCLPPLIQKTVSVSIMFGTYNEYSNFLQKQFPSISPFLCLSISSVLAGTTEAILMPFERIQTLLQDRNYHKQFHNTFHAFRELRKFGTKEYFRGLTAILMRNGPSNIMFFSLRGKVKETLPTSNSWLGHLIIDFVSGAVVGAIISTIFYPVNVVKTKMQVQYGTRFLSFSEALHLTYVERGYRIKNMFYGVHINYTRALISWGIINASYELLKKIFYPSSAARCTT
ncbi:solute carrier family 25 member 51-like [Limulus polyphemus]|uniref:Solute carrier family 25 member 51-like n=1 Tax=Limulus polyphemus TaxID=6850 RepID=A0ABM1AZY7_LIMPO|nr:solute carrier family 25 member 51-like [Limulus polyphemus]XP_013771965.1 solute carrier family 25 member 51-like [Limulus polyphemus]XP_022238646.1 solute carrier family 25 member 51-like [Limulus polyphemus]XP_022238647.1 solute carrier family 25 member 51-like [Limulus polyphemus]XP_022238649.1 solute carrier family 25 member 51-like [Limulus polyphemus]XP_022238650.1 solute carrier family 25 member 51-like [Limulus polyphemus]